MSISVYYNIFKIILFIHFLSIQSHGADRKFPIGLLNNFHYFELPEKPQNVILPEAEWFHQRLDHFNAQETRTWKQRYFSSFAHYKKGGPVFIMIGGEGPAMDFFLVFGAWIEWAKKHNAALFLLEHRFYGESHPTPDLSTENLQWLSSRQGLNDLANFIEAMTEKHNFTGPWIAYGGSYPGSMAAWLRLKFPHLISGSVSSSGPLEAKVDYYEYLQVVYEALGRDGPQCNIAWKEAITAIEDIIETPNQWKELEKLFKLCGPFDGTKEEDVAAFMHSLVNIAADAVQNDYTNRIFNISMDITEVCQIMTEKKNGKSALERLVHLNAQYLSTKKRPCSNATHQFMIDILSNIEFGFGSWQRAWTYQTCSEFGWYQTSDQPKHPYGSRFPIEDYIKLCTDVFGESFNASYIEENIENSNSYYGSKDLDVENVVFVHGSIDPWHPMGRTTDLNEVSPAIMIEGASHINDMFPNNKNDSRQLIQARTRISQLVDKWVNDAKYRK